MSSEIFTRLEKKYVLSLETAQTVQQAISARLSPDIHNIESPTYQICNIYCDSANNDLIRTSLRSPPYKEKLRLRSYGTPDDASTVFVEIKKKYRGVVYKRRSAIRLCDAYAFLETAEIPENTDNANVQVLREAQYMILHYGLKPRLYLSYDRRAYVDEDSDLRISFDTNILTRRHDLRLENGAYGISLLQPGTCLMEIKTSNNYPLWLCDLLSDLEVYPSGFSKYGAEYENTLKGNNYA